MNPNPQQIIMALSVQLTNAMVERDEALLKLQEAQAELEELKKVTDVQAQIKEAHKPKQ